MVDYVKISKFDLLLAIAVSLSGVFIQNCLGRINDENSGNTPHEKSVCAHWYRTNMHFFCNKQSVQTPMMPLKWVLRPEWVEATQGLRDPNKHLM